MRDPQSVWKVVDAVCFDVDSTVIQEEGIDELAKFCNKGEIVASLTSKAMAGSMTFQESLKQRLDIIKPGMQQIKEFLLTRPPSLTPGIKNLVNLLHHKDIPVFLISGGFRLKFYFTGEYAGFDDTEPTSKSGGKAIVIEMLKKKYGFSNLVHIGDGATDLEACPPADAFIGYGGNVIRESVRSKAKWFVTDFNELMDHLKE